MWKAKKENGLVFGAFRIILYLCIYKTKTMRLYRLLLWLFAVTVGVPVLADGVGNTCPWVHITPERLPDLNTPREGHAVFFAGGELTVAGGHTNGFVPTATAEYLRDGEWHQLPMTYTHDHGTALVLRSGQVLLAGGSKEEMGVGQTFGVEMYNPADHSFTGFGCLSRKRTLASALSWTADEWSSRATGMPTMVLRCSTAGNSLPLSRPSSA